MTHLHNAHGACRIVSYTDANGYVIVQSQTGTASVPRDSLRPL